MGLISRINAAHSANMEKLDAKAAAMRARVEERDAERVANRPPAAPPPAPAVPVCDLVAEYNGVRLGRDRIGYKGESRPLPGVRARVDEHRTGQEWGGWDQRDVYLTISGPGFEWAIRTNAIWSSRKAREFAAKVNSAGSATTTPGPGVAGVADELGKLAELHRSGALTDEEYAAAKQRAIGV